jgi:hypothetical protein
MRGGDAATNAKGSAPLALLNAIEREKKKESLRASEENTKKTDGREGKQNQQSIQQFGRCVSGQHTNSTRPSALAIPNGLSVLIN